MSAAPMIEYVEAEFDHHDNGDGKMDKMEFTSLIRSIHKECTDADINQIFNECDKIGNNDGRLTKAELIEGVKKLFVGVVETIEEIFEKHADKDGNMDDEDLLAFLTYLGMTVPAERLDQIFKHLDSSGNGWLSKSEVMHIFAE